MSSGSVRCLPFSPIYERNKIFAFDFVFFLAQEYRTTWIPYGWPDYFIDPLSPMTSDVQDGARVLLRNRDGFFMQKYYLELVPPGTVGNSRIFHEHAKRTFQSLFDRFGSIEEFFYTMVCVGRLGIYFYQQGFYDAPNYAVVVIGEALLHYITLYGPGVFPTFCVIGQNLVANPESDPY